MQGAMFLVAARGSLHLNIQQPFRVTHCIQRWLGLSHVCTRVCTAHGRPLCPLQARLYKHGPLPIVASFGRAIVFGSMWLRMDACLPRGYCTSIMARIWGFFRNKCGTRWQRILCHHRLNSEQIFGERWTVFVCSFRSEVFSPSGGDSENCACHCANWKWSRKMCNLMAEQPLTITVSLGTKYSRQKGGLKIFKTSTF